MKDFERKRNRYQAKLERVVLERFRKQFRLFSLRYFRASCFDQPLKSKEKFQKTVSFVLSNGQRQNQKKTARGSDKTNRSAKKLVLVAENKIGRTALGSINAI